MERFRKINYYENIANDIISKIEKGEWLVGEKIPKETDLASYYSVSRNALREAIKGLILQEILIAFPGKGTFITDGAMSKIYKKRLVEGIIEDASLIDLMEVRILLEPEMAYWAALRASKREIQKLERIVEECESLNANSGDALLISPLQFHVLLSKISGQKIGMKIMEAVSQEILEQRKIFLQMPFEDQKKGLSEHAELLGFIKTKDAESAKLLMYTHLKRGLCEIASLLKS